MYTFNIYLMVLMHITRCSDEMSSVPMQFERGRWTHTRVGIIIGVVDQSDQAKNVRNFVILFYILKTGLCNWYRVCTWQRTNWFGDVVRCCAGSHYLLSVPTYTTGDCRMPSYAHECIATRNSVKSLYINKYKKIYIYMNNKDYN